MRISVLLGTIALSGSILMAQQISTIHGGGGITLPPPPPTVIHPVTDHYRECVQLPCSGKDAATKSVAIVDNYRWLEDGKSAQTRQWIKAQMAYTDAYLRQVKIRPQIARQLTALMNVDTQTMPLVEKSAYFFEKRNVGQSQPSIFMRRGLHGADELLIDATKLSKDQNTSVSIWGASSDARLLIYGVRVGGADQETIHIRDIASGHDFADVLPVAATSVSVSRRMTKASTTRSTPMPERACTITRSVRLPAPTK